MEKQKNSEPRYSENLKELAMYLHSCRDGSSLNTSRLSKFDLETASVFTGAGIEFNNFKS